MRSLVAMIVAGLVLLWQPPVRAAGNVVIGVADTLTGFDVHTISDTLSQSAARMMLQGLFGFDSDLKPVPVLAESYEANSEATEFTFYLRKGVRFHDGTPFNAEAVRINFERLVNPENRLSRASLLSMARSFTVVDEFTLRISLKTPFAALINTLAHPGTMIHSPAALARHGRDVMRHPVGTGPFRFAEWQADRLKVVRNEHYWKPGLPKVDSITLRSVPENGSRLAMLLAGEAHAIAPLPPEQVSVAEANPAIDVVRRPSIVTWYMAMNTRKAPFNDVRVRQALNLAVDKQAYRQVVWNGFAAPLTAPVPPGLPMHAEQQPWPYDPERARALLGQAGYPNGFSVELMGAGNTLARRAMQFLQQQLAAVGVQVRITPLDAGMIAERIWRVADPAAATIELFYAGWSASTGDPDWQLRPLFFGPSAPPALNNVAYYSNPAVDAAIMAGLSTIDPQRRAEAYRVAQEIIWTEAPWVFLGVETLLAGKAKSVAGLHYLPDRSLSLDEVELK
ncbi:MAG TPA: glutathione ABC transporter substrate-binding protein [Beijerinckiaceae bacterium]|nr:glutathione ABC transporter substrate-binding protein [Beijerinckiaceae bacterium]